MPLGVSAKYWQGDRSPPQWSDDLPAACRRGGGSRRPAALTCSTSPLGLVDLVSADQTCPMPKFHGAKMVLEAPCHSQVFTATE